jgi:hypothetical protein
MKDTFMPLLINLIRSVHKAPEGGAHLVCHEDEKHQDEELQEDDVEVINLHEECVKHQTDQESIILDLQN